MGRRYAIGVRRKDLIVVREVKSQMELAAPLRVGNQWDMEIQLHIDHADRIDVPTMEHSIGLQPLFGSRCVLTERGRDTEKRKRENQEQVAWSHGASRNGTGALYMAVECLCQVKT